MVHSVSNNVDTEYIRKRFINYAMDSVANDLHSAVVRASFTIYSYARVNPYQVDTILHRGQFLMITGDSALWVKIMGPLNIEGATIWWYFDSLVVIDRFARTAYTGVLDTSLLPVWLYEVVRAGRLPWFVHRVIAMRPLNVKKVEVRLDTCVAYSYYSDWIVEQAYLFKDSNTFMPLYLRLNKLGITRPVLTVTYQLKDVRQDKSRLYWHVTSPYQSIEIDFRQISFNKQVNPPAPKVPSGFKILPLDSLVDNHAGARLE